MINVVSHWCVLFTISRYEKQKVAYAVDKRLILSEQKRVNLSECYRERLHYSKILTEAVALRINGAIYLIVTLATTLQNVRSINYRGNRG